MIVDDERSATVWDVAIARPTATIQHQGVLCADAHNLVSPRPGLLVRVMDASTGDDYITKIQVFRVVASPNPFAASTLTRTAEVEVASARKVKTSCTTAHGKLLVSLMDVLTVWSVDQAHGTILLEATLVAPGCRPLEAAGPVATFQRFPDSRSKPEKVSDPNIWCMCALPGASAIVAVGHGDDEFQSSFDLQQVEISTRMKDKAFRLWNLETRTCTALEDLIGVECCAPISDGRGLRGFLVYKVIDSVPYDSDKRTIELFIVDVASGSAQPTGCMLPDLPRSMTPLPVGPEKIDKWVVIVGDPEAYGDTIYGDGYYGDPYVKVFDVTTRAYVECCWFDGKAGSSVKLGPGERIGVHGVQTVSTMARGNALIRAGHVESLPWHGKHGTIDGTTTGERTKLHTKVTMWLR